MSSSESKSSVTTPLLPISDLLSEDVSSTASTISNKVDLAVSDGLKKMKDKENEKVSSIIRKEIAHLVQLQEKNNNDIKTKAAELQGIRENNLVVSGAVSGLKKVLKEIENGKI